jgi:hypothetical protein
MTSQPGRRAAAVQSCSGALEAGRPARRRRELVWGREIWWFNLTKNVRRRIRPRRRYVTGDISGTMVGIGRRPADGDRVGADAPSHDHPLRRPVLSLVVKRRILSAICGECSPHANRRQTSVTGHVASDGRAVGGGCVCEISDFAARHDSDPVGEFQYLVEVLRHQENGGAAVTLLHDLRPNVGD